MARHMLAAGYDDFSKPYLNPLPSFIAEIFDSTNKGGLYNPGNLANVLFKQNMKLDSHYACLRQVSFRF